MYYCSSSSSSSSSSSCSSSSSSSCYCIIVVVVVGIIVVRSCIILPSETLPVGTRRCERFTITAVAIDMRPHTFFHGYKKRASDCLFLSVNFIENLMCCDAVEHNRPVLLC